MRIYLPATVLDLAAADGLSPRLGHTLTPALAAELGVDDVETGEFAALQLAAWDSLDRLRAEPAAPRRRVVVAADVPGAEPEGSAASAVSAPMVPWSAVASLHLDEDSAEVRDVLDRLIADGDDAALAKARDLDLLWFDVAERDQVARGATGQATAGPPA